MTTKHQVNRYELELLFLEQELDLTRAALEKAKARLPQSRTHSALETLLSTFIGFSISVAANYFLLPIWGYSPSAADAIEIGILFTWISLLRGYAIRRFFNWIHTRT